MDVWLIYNCYNCTDTCMAGLHTA
ncbi:DUF1062 domain-containing protein [Faecalibaculum rodentium]